MVLKRLSAPYTEAGVSGGMGALPEGSYHA
jgi:hypothetical protein